MLKCIRTSHNVSVQVRLTYLYIIYVIEGANETTDGLHLASIKQTTKYWKADYWTRNQ